MPSIIPIKDLKNTSEISQLCHESSEPIYITKNGYGDMVVMSIEQYENSIFLTEVYEKLRVATEQVNKSKTKEMDIVLQGVKGRLHV